MFARYMVAGISCYVMHQLLAMQYAEMCSSSWFSVLGLDTTPSCSLLRRSMEALRWSPVGLLMLQQHQHH